MTVFAVVLTASCELDHSYITKLQITIVLMSFRLCMLSGVIVDDVNSTFNFWCNYKIYQGTWLKGDLYYLLQETPQQEVHKIFSLIYTLSSQEKKFCVTKAENLYSVWVSLKSLKRGNCIYQSLG